MCHPDDAKTIPGGRTKRVYTANDPDYRYPWPKTIQLYIYWTKSAENWHTVLWDYAMKAQSMLIRHHIDLRAYPGLPSLFGPDFLIDWKDDITLHDHREQIVGFSQKVAATPGDALPVILCTIEQGREGLLQGNVVRFKERPFVFIYGNTPSAADGVTLLHEIGHAADATHHPPWGLGRPDKRYSFMATPAEFRHGSEELAMTKDPRYFRNTIFRPDVRKLAEAPFAVPSGLCSWPKLSGIGW